MFRIKEDKPKVILLPPAQIAPNPAQPRTNFNPDELETLCESIRTNGLLQPVTVRRAGSGYELVAGERRLRACKMAGLTQIPCILVDVNEEQSAIFALIENIQRSNLDFFEEAEAILMLISENGLTQEELSHRLGKAQSTVANKLRLLKLSDTERKLILRYKLTERHARALLKLPDEKTRDLALDAIIRRGMNVYESEKYIEQMLRPKPAKLKPLAIMKDIRLFYNTIGRAVDTMKSAGIPVTTEKSEYPDYVEYRIRIPSSAQRQAQ